MVSFDASSTSSYFSDSEISTGNIITTGHWVVEPVEKDGCKDGGWQDLIDPETGEVFKNQGQCVSHTNHSNLVDNIVQNL